MIQEIQEALENCSAVIEELKESHNLDFIIDSAEMIAKAFRKGRKILIAGNGGSMADSMHFAEELTGQFRKKRRALPAIALADPTHLSCCANDFGFEQVFARGVEAYGKEDDIFIFLSTSGNSENIVLAYQMAKRLGLKTIAFLGKNGGKLKGKADLEMIISAASTSDRIQEAHMAAIHILIEMLEKLLFYSEEKELLGALR